MDDRIPRPEHTQRRRGETTDKHSHQLQQAYCRLPLTAHPRRAYHLPPRVRTFPARHDGRRTLRLAHRHQRSPRLRRAALADNGELGFRARLPRDLRPALPERRSHPLGDDRKDSRRQELSCSLLSGAPARLRHPGHGLALPQRSPRAGCQGVRERDTQALRPYAADPQHLHFNLFQPYFLRWLFRRLLLIQVGRSA